MGTEAEPKIPACGECGRSDRVHHFADFSHEGDPEYAYFECVRCARQWTDFKLSEALLGMTDAKTTGPV